MFYFLRQLYSLETVTRLWEKSPSTGDRYQAVVYVRPDLLFESPLPVADTLDVIDEEHSKRILRPRTVFSPNFDVFGGMNDRFALGTPDVMSVYGYRKNDIDRFMGESNQASPCRKLFSLGNEGQFNKMRNSRFFL